MIDPQAPLAAQCCASPLEGGARCDPAKPGRARRGRAAQGGAALLVAMIVVALVATLAAGALWRQWRGVEVEAAERARLQADWVLVGALDWGRLILRADGDTSNVDHLGEPWAVPLAEARLSTFLAAGQASQDVDRDAFLSGQITDLQSRLNLMNLACDDPQQRLFATQVFRRLFAVLGLPAGEVDLIQRGLLAARQAALGTATAPGNAPLLPQRLEQLAWLGVSPQTIVALAPYATLLPDPGVTPVNINTASAEAIYAAAPDLDLASARRLVALRQQSYFSDVPSALTAIDVSGVQQQWLDVKTNYFEIRGRLRLDAVALEEVCVARRDNTPASHQVVPLWRYRTPLTLAPTGG